MPSPGDIRPPFDLTSAACQSFRLAEDAWNTPRPPCASPLAYTEDTEWRNRAEFLNGRRGREQQVNAFLRRVNGTESSDFSFLRKELWAFTDNRHSSGALSEYECARRQWPNCYRSRMANERGAGIPCQTGSCKRRYARHQRTHHRRSVAEVVTTAGPLLLRPGVGRSCALGRVNAG
jgi:nuclear transport factor 2 (NTF2) superfamily protein